MGESVRKNVYTVAQINSYIKNMFTQDYLLKNVTVKGEVSNLTYHQSGHIYLTLKDKSSVISLVMWRSDRAAGLSFSLKEGMQILATGQIGTYEASGKYQLYASKIEEEGVGDLYMKFLRLKEELEDRGMFDEMYKKPIPSGCKTLGVVTAPTGAAIRDIISIAKKRNPFIKIILYPAKVQGEGAAEEIVKGIKCLEKQGVDIIIAGRGGGSLEDLWAFNEEIVAEAIFDCTVPVISAVGHETDITLSDFVADKRAETPSAAAVMAVDNVVEIMEELEAIGQLLYTSMKNIIHRKRMDILLKGQILAGENPISKINDKRKQCEMMHRELNAKIMDIIKDRKQELKLLVKDLQGVSPLEKLSQGYSFTENDEGKCVSSIDGISMGDNIRIYVKNGIIGAVVKTKNRYDYGFDGN